MNRPKLSEDIWPIIDSIRRIIKEGDVEIGEKKPGTGWEYCGEHVARQVTLLEEILNKSELEIVKSNVLHLVQGGRLHNPTRHLYIFPLQGTASFGPEETLLPYTYIYKDTKVIYGNNVDLIIIALRRK
ncbi:hypothetical protein BJY00DRAFT_315809 [Aspergillus carlsbadensis]|nr:hypothetical protein BJY00DRAFT_315809 [Aspergillus carlsbadensis]